MQYTVDSATRKLLDSYEAYYNIIPAEEDNQLLTARCEFFECSERYVVSQNAKLWTANCEEFLYLFHAEHLTKELFEKCRDFAYEDGMSRAKIGPGHMYTYITPVIVCDTCDEQAKKTVKKCRIYKSFLFSLHGWMDFHVAVLEVTGEKITTNPSGRCVEKIMKKVLFQKKKI